MVLYVEEWVYLNFHSDCHNLYLPGQVLVQKHHLVWSWSDQMCIHSMALLRVWRLRSTIQNFSVATALFYMEYSLANGPIMSSVHNEESSWGKLNHGMLLCTSLLRFILRVESNSMNVSKWCMMDPIRSKLCMSIDPLVHAICTCVFKGERVIVFKWSSVVHLVMCEVAFVIQSKSIKLFRDVATGPNLSLITGPICAYHIPWILVISNDLDAGTAFDCICCFCQLAV